VGVASYIALDARSDYNAASARCPGGMCVSLADYETTRDARQRASTMTWVFGGGVVIAAVGTYLLATSTRTVAADRLSIRPLIDAHGGGIAIGGAL
ncbi:MAG TPA: hypothetical protein VK427_22305, partial [Kofleriaceae bacterium]|nr:hypothetical protein [Kofleriaceae bacterium]